VHISGLRHQGLPVVIIDVEASALEQGSYPIEIGWAPGHAAEFESFLIRPTEEWVEGGIWSDLSEEIHGISKAELQTAGVSAPEAIARLEAGLAGSIVLSDAIEWDGYWLRRLFETANRPCPVKLQPFNRVVKEVALANGIDPELVAQRIEDWALVTSEAGVHRAGPDAADNYRQAIATMSANRID